MTGWPLSFTFLSTAAKWPEHGASRGRRSQIWAGLHHGSRPATGPVSGLDENKIGLSTAAGRSCDWEPGAAFVSTPVSLTRASPGAFLTAPWKDSLPAATERVPFCWIRSRLSFQGKHVFPSVGPPEGQENPADAEQRLPLSRRAGVLVTPATLHRAHRAVLTLAWQLRSPSWA